MGKPKPKRPVTEYYMTIHYAICQGPIRSLNRLIMEEKEAWIGHITTETSFEVENLELFGGVKKEGGVKGRVYYQVGDFLQKNHADVAAKLDLTPDTMPGYRGIATACFTQPAGYHYPGFYWGANRPTVPPVWFDVQRIPDGWYPETAAILRGDGEFKHETWSTLQTTLDADYLDEVPITVMHSNGYAFAPENYTLEFRGILKDRAATNWPEGKKGLQLQAYRSSNDLPGGEPEGEVAALEATSIGDYVTVKFPEEPDKFYLFEIFHINNSFHIGIGNQAVWDVHAHYIGVWSTETNGELLELAYYDSNPAHIIYECLTNTVWGMGAPPTAVDEASFIYAADTLYAENFGLSMIWTQQATIEEFIQEVLDHIEGHLFVDPATGLFRLKLVRNDYDPETLFIFDESNCIVDSYQVRSPAEIINEINVTWTDPINEKESVYTIQDLGGIVVTNGQIVSDSRNYYGIRSGELAAEIAARDISIVTAPVATAEITTNRIGWKYVPGDVVKFSSVQHKASEIIMRVVKVDYGSPRRPEVKINIIQDIFSFERPVLGTPATTSFEDPAKLPTVPEYTKIITLNFFLSSYFLPELTSLDTEYPDVYLAVLVSTTNRDTFEIELLGDETDPAGNVTRELMGTRSIVSRGTLPQAFVQEASTLCVAFTGSTVGTGPVPGGFGLVGPDAALEAEAELVLFKSFDGTHWTILRGALDTIPREWPLGTPIRFLSAVTDVADEVTRGASETVSYQVLTRTSLGLLNAAEAPEVNYTATERPHLPTRPADVEINGVSFVQTNVEGVDPITVTWANRNRVTEDSQLLDWDGADVTPEVGQVTRITVRDAYDDTQTFTVDVAEGLTTYGLVPADFGASSLVIVRVTAVRDGFESLQAYEQRLVVDSGYGYNYGDDYGGLS